MPEVLPTGAGVTGVHGVVMKCASVPPVIEYDMEVMGVADALMMVASKAQQEVSISDPTSESQGCVISQGSMSKQTLSHRMRLTGCGPWKNPYRMQTKLFAGDVSVKMKVCVLLPTGMVEVGGVTLPL
jgi:hypothetical protein